jgi:hypothetical protein
MYDMTPNQMKSQDYIQVGIAPRNKQVDIGQIRYEPNFKDYIRANKVNDKSQIMAGFTDQYDIIPNPDPDVKPNYPDDPDHPIDPGAEKNYSLLYAFVGVSAAFIVLIVVTVICCRRKKRA